MHTDRRHRDDAVSLAELRDHVTHELSDRTLRDQHRRDAALLTFFVDLEETPVPADPGDVRARLPKKGGQIVA